MLFNVHSLSGERYKVTSFHGEGDILSLSGDDADECVQIARSTSLRRLSPRARFDQAPLNLGQILSLVSYSSRKYEALVN